MTALKLFTSESVTEGHPDKVCDQISDALLDAILEQDPTARVALETMVTTGQVHVAGELTTCAYIDAPNIIREVINNIGYTDSRLGFDGKSVGINLSIDNQSPDIAQGVDIINEDPETQGSADKTTTGNTSQFFMVGNLVLPTNGTENASVQPSLNQKKPLSQ